MISAVITSLALASFGKNTYSAINQILTDTFHQNPAELSLVNHAQLMIGDLFINPRFKFRGNVEGTFGSATSNVSNNLPYFLGDYRLTERFVLGLNVTPSGYDHIEWPNDSIVAIDHAATKVELLNYRVGVQSSYQLTDDLAVGGGLNLEINKLEEIDLLVINRGIQVNKDSGLDYNLDVGLLYKINPRHSLTIAAYTPVNMIGSGTSSLGETVSHSFRLGDTLAAVVYIGLKHVLNDTWTIEEKVYWSGWYIQKTLNFENSATGSFAAPTNWKDVWSYRVTTRYAMSEKTTLFGSVTYETNPNPTPTNNPGFPLAPVTFFTGGLDINLLKNLSAQLIYGCGILTPNAKINHPSNKDETGSVSGKIQDVGLQFTYKI